MWKIYCEFPPEGLMIYSPSQMDPKPSPFPLIGGGPFHFTRPLTRGFCTKSIRRHGHRVTWVKHVKFSTWSNRVTQNIILPIKKATSYFVNFIPNRLDEIFIFFLIEKNRKLFVRFMLIIVFMLSFSLVILKIIELRDATHLLQLDLVDLKAQNEDLINQINLKKKSLMTLNSTSNSNNTSFFYRHEKSLWCITGILSYTIALGFISLMQDTTLIDYYDQIIDFVNRSEEIKQNASEMQDIICTKADNTDKLYLDIEAFYRNTEDLFKYLRNKALDVQNSLTETDSQLKELSKLVDSINKDT